jgi:hypothetical protein
MNFIKKNIIKLNFIIIGFSILALPILFYINFNITAELTYEKKFFILQAGKPSFSEEISLQKRPIINSETLSRFSKESVVDIFSHNIHESNQHIKDMKIYFTDLGYKNFVASYKPVLETDIETETLVRSTFVTKGPYLLGTANILGEGRVWKYVLKVLELREGLGAQQQKNKSIELILKEIKFSKNKKGVAIDSIVVK